MEAPDQAGAQMSRAGNALILAAAAASLLIPSTALARGGGAQTGITIGNLQKTDSPEPCVVTESNSNQRLAAGSGPVKINTTIFNCSSSSHDYVVSLHDFYEFPNELASCIGSFAPWTSPPVTLKPWETRTFSFERPLPTCIGTYVIDGRVYTPDMTWGGGLPNRVAAFEVLAK
jgi:hypothetical protein